MRDVCWVYARLLLLSIGVIPIVASADTYPSLERHTFVHDGVEREFFVHKPERASGALPVVLAVHGYSSTATGFAAFHDLRAHADRNGYIVVYPQGPHFVHENDDGPYRITSWNLLAGAEPEPDSGPQCLSIAVRYPCPPECGVCDRCTWATCYDDLGYFDRLLDIVEASYETDTNRYYALGVSNGGMMTLRLGCDRSSRFAAIAPIIAQMPEGYGCRPDTMLPMIHFSSGKDNVVRPDGKPAGDGFVYISVAKTAADWAAALQCKHGPEEWTTERSGEAGLTCTAHTDCAVDGHEVVSCSDPDETHNWPKRRPGGAWPTCVTSQQKDAMPEQRLCAPREETGPHLGMDIIWAFFEQFERQSN